MTDRTDYNRQQKAAKRAAARGDFHSPDADIYVRAVSAFADIIADKVVRALSKNPWSELADNGGTTPPFRGGVVVPQGVRADNDETQSADKSVRADAFDPDTARVNVSAIRDALVEMNPRPGRRRQDLE